jgi:hypothetical protein
MPLIPLFTTPRHPQATHQVLAPGGYERWRLEAEDSTSQLRIVIEFWLGDWTDPAYRKAYDRYRRRPTRFAPPTPVEYPSVRVTITRANQSIVESVSRFKATDVRVVVDQPGVMIGANQFVLGENGSWRVTLRNAELCLDPSGAVQGNITARDERLVINCPGKVLYDFSVKPAL